MSNSEPVYGFDELYNQENPPDPHDAYDVSLDQSHMTTEAQQEAFLDNDRLLVRVLTNPQHPAYSQALEYLNVRTLQIVRRHRSLWIKDLSLSDEDICQNVLMTVFSGIGTFKHQSAFLTWLTVIIRNEARQLGRKQTTKSRDTLKVSLDDSSITDRDESVESLAIHNTMIDSFESILNQQKDDRLLTIFRMYYHQDATLEMIGSTLNLGTSRVHALLKSVRQLLQNYLEWE
ncbi:MAG TPA: sigma-70 family RNA polymerase sigma factor [Herpetosiphonaceae bacterium]|nr:sigma-70 family RNA polymerase sigma factor [Herpetosiphonaceae bacterium]